MLLWSKAREIIGKPRADMAATLSRLPVRFAKHDVAPDTGWLARLAPRMDGVPEWWLANKNVLLVEERTALPQLMLHPGREPPRRSLVAVGRSSAPVTIVLWGSEPVVAIAPRSNLPGGYFTCGDESTIWIGSLIECMGQPQVDARNGGLVYIEGDGLWSERVKLHTDDMHAIREIATGRRVNDFGGRVIVERRVWLGLEALLLPGAHVGAGGVVGARAVVSGRLPENSVSVGIPARPVRQGVTWTHEDLP